MPRISQQTIEAVRNVSVVELADALGDPIKRVGRNYNIPCPNPQHTERTPDTYIKGNTNIWKCFGGGGCGAKGADAITYYSWHEFGAWNPNQHFVDAVIGIATLMGIEVVYENGKRAPAPHKQKKRKHNRFHQANPADPNTCDQVYRRWLELCDLRREHAEELIGSKRQYEKEDVLNIGFRSCPKSLEEIKSNIRYPYRRRV